MNGKEERNAAGEVVGRTSSVVAMKDRAAEPDRADKRN